MAGAESEASVLELLALIGSRATLDRVQSPGTRFSVCDPELEYMITEHDGLFVVQTSERGGGPIVAMASESLDIAARGLLVLLAIPLRQQLGFGHSFRARGLAAGTVLERDVDGLRLRLDDPSAPASAWLPDTSSGLDMAAKLSYLLGPSLEHVVEFLCEPDGGPLYSPAS